MAKQQSATAANAATSAKAAAKKRVVKVDSIGDAHINATFNNIIISLTNTAGQVISWSSAGKMGFRGSKKTHLMQLKWPHRIVVNRLLMQVYEK